jgi:hypothetical protein
VEASTARSSARSCANTVFCAIELRAPWKKSFVAKTFYHGKPKLFSFLPTTPNRTAVAGGDFGHKKAMRASLHEQRQLLTLERSGRAEGRSPE